jgi:hypothetical protein
VIGLGWMGMLYDIADRGAGDGCTATGEGAAYDEEDGLLNISRREYHCLTCMRKHA